MIKKETDKKITAFCDNLMDEVKQAESAPEIYIQSVNDFLIKMVTEGGLVPISLKKQTSEVSISVKENNIHPIPKGKIDVVKGHLVKPKAYAKFDVVDTKGGGKIDFVSNSFKFTAEIQVGTTANRWHIEERMSSKTSSKKTVRGRPVAKKTQPKKKATIKKVKIAKTSRIKKATSIIEDIIGEKVVSWRCPRLFGGTEVTNSLETLGYECDATYPMYYYGNHLFPYRAHAEIQGNVEIAP